MHLFRCKSTFPTERIARLSLVKRAVSGSWLRDWKHFVYIRYSVVSSLANQFIVSRSIPPIFLTKNHPPLPKGGKATDFLICLSVAEIWCKQVVYVQTCGLHRRSMNAPTMLIYKYICLWPTKINHGYTVGATIGRLISNYLNCFLTINQQFKQTANPALFGKESCQRSWLRDCLGKLFDYISAVKYNPKHTANLPSLCKGGWCERLANTGRVDWNNFPL